MATFLLHQRFGTVTNNLMRYVCRFYTSEPTLVFKNINHFGSLLYNCPKVPTIVKCINPHDVPNGDTAFVDLVDYDSGIKIDATKILENFFMNYCSQDHILHLSAKNEFSLVDGAALLIQIPHNYDIDIVGSNVHVQETEGSVLKVNSHGECKLGKIKAGTVDIESSGPLVCKSLLGNGQLNCKADATIGKIQAKNLRINSSGNIIISSCYSPQLQCQSHNGSIDIGSLHGVSNLRTGSGTVSVSTLAGDTNIQTDSGDISLTVESCGHAFALSEQGNINIGLSETVSAFIEGSAAYIDIPEDLLFDGMKRETSTGIQKFEGKVGSGDSGITVETLHGTISFSRKSWFSKFNVDLD